MTSPPPFRATTKSTFTVTGRSTVITMDILDGVVRVGDGIEVPLKAGGHRHLKVIGVDYADIGVGTPAFRSETALTVDAASIAPDEVAIGEEVLAEPNFVVSLRIHEGDVGVDELERDLGLKPNTAWRKGHVRLTPKGTEIPGPPAKVNYCTFPLEALAGEDLGEALARLTSMLENHRDILMKVRATGGTMNFFIGWFVEGNIVDLVKAELMGRLSALGLDLVFDVYAGGRHFKPGGERKYDVSSGAPGEAS
jgi:Domain of unknown function (DUF4279)